MLKKLHISRVQTLALLLVVLALGVSPAAAQTQASTGQIVGSVRDAAGAYIPNATVKAVQSQTGLDRTVTTNADGQYRFVLLPPGQYKVTANAQGFAEAKAELTVQVGRTADLNLQLAVGTVQQEVTVTTEAVQVTRSEPDALFNQTAIENLPINGRRFHDFMVLTPGAQIESSRNQISLSGQRGINGSVTIDGLDYNQPFFGGIRGGERSNNAFTIPQESIQEFQVVSAGYSAEFGRSSGGQISAVTKSGTNDIHGSGFYVLRHKDLARSNNMWDAISENLGRSLTVSPTQQQFGGSLGGPIKKDKLFFFTTYEQQVFRNNREVFFDRLVGFTPNAASQEAYDYYKSQEGKYVQTNDANAVLGRVDWQLSEKHRMNVRYNWSRNIAKNATTAGTAVQPTVTNALSNNGTEKDNTHTVVGSLSSLFSSTIANELRAQWSREQRPREANAFTPTVSSVVGTYGTVNFLPTTEFDWRVQIADNITISRGTHTLKTGFEFNRTFADQLFGFGQYGEYGGIPGSVVQDNLDMLGVGGVTVHRFDNSATTYRKQVGNLAASMAMNQYSGFVQDTWRVNQRFTLNYGLRWDGVWNPQPEATNTSLVAKVKNFAFPLGKTFDPTIIANQPIQVGPRLGFSWDPEGNGKSVIRGFGGIYYANTPLLLYASPINNFRATPGDVRVQLPFTNYAGRTTNTAVPCSAGAIAGCDTLYEQFNLIGVNLDSFALDKLPVLTTDQIGQIAGMLGLTVDPLQGAQVIGVASNYHNPRSYQAGFGYEREVMRQVTVGLDFNWISTVYLQRNTDLNLKAPTVLTTGSNTTLIREARPFFGLVTGGVTRPISSLSGVQIRDDSARSLYRSAALRVNAKRSWGQVNLYYTLSENTSSDDNERDSGGQAMVDSFNRGQEYGFSNLDRRHQFTAAPVVYLPWGFEAASTITVRSGKPFSGTVGLDANEDGVNNDRVYFVQGVPSLRNSFRNLPTKNVDLRVQKVFKLKERQQIKASVEVFNLLNVMNVSLAGTQLRTCNSYSKTTFNGCGLTSLNNPNFKQIYDMDPASTKPGRILVGNDAGVPTQIQLGVRYSF